MTLARCPACHTTFRIAPEQLDRRDGRVRCGKCFHPFNAREHALESVRPADVTPAPDSRPASRPASRMTSSGLDETPPDDAFTLLPPDSSFFQAVVEAQRRKGSSDHIPAEPDRADPEQPTPTDAASQHPTARASHPFFEADGPDAWLSEPLRSLPKETPPEIPPAELEDTILPEVFHHRREEPAQRRPGFSIADEDDLHHASLQEPAPDTAPVTHPQEMGEENEEDDDLEAWRDEVYRPAAPRERRRGLWALGLGVLLGVFVAQAGYIYREPLTRVAPQLRPVYLAVCAQLNCEVPLPRVADALAIVRSHLERQPDTLRGYQLFATIRNSASYPQEYPHLELTLRDKNDQPLARRVFSPQEWAPEERNRAEGMQAEEHINLSLPFSTDPRAEPVGYRITVFYP